MGCCPSFKTIWNRHYPAEPRTERLCLAPVRSSCRIRTRRCHQILSSICSASSKQSRLEPPRLRKARILLSAMSSFRLAAFSRMVQKFCQLIDHLPAALNWYQGVLQTESWLFQDCFDAGKKHEIERLGNQIDISNLPGLADDEGSKPDWWIFTSFYQIYHFIIKISKYYIQLSIKQF